jgi:RNA polymerase sigma-70 factor (ECF subfamily)
MDRAVFDKLVADHQAMVLSVASAVLRDYHAAQDVAQEVFLKALQALESVRDASKIRTWLATIARNRAINLLHALDRRDRLHQRKAQSDCLRHPLPSPCTPIEELLLRLREEYRQIVLLRYVYELSYHEIAAVLDVSPGAVAQMLHRVKRSIRQSLKEPADAV